jgi:2-dehydro-3-deoxyphosphogluconate aldolase/(4S)-4-hydroxy-2-oxoglutarate aldolase
MSKNIDLERVLQRGLVAVLRASRCETFSEVVAALLAGGVDIVEVTFTVDRPLAVIETLAQRFGDRILLGAGSVLDAPTARAALLAGARFVVSPVVKLDVIQMCRRYDVLVMPGAFTPTEALTAWEAGADVVKIFPSEIAGPEYLQALRGPLPQVRLMPTGGVTRENAGEFLRAGACALGVGGSLAGETLIRGQHWDEIAQRAAQFVEIVRRTRADLANKG